MAVNMTASTSLTGGYPTFGDVRDDILRDLPPGVDGDAILRYWRVIVAGPGGRATLLDLLRGDLSMLAQHYEPGDDPNQGGRVLWYLPWYFGGTVPLGVPLYIGELLQSLGMLDEEFRARMTFVPAQGVWISIDAWCFDPGTKTWVEKPFRGTLG